MQTTLDEFSAAGIEVKILSGDNPKTVSALAAQAGVRSAARPNDDAHASAGPVIAVAGADLEGLSPEEMADVAERATVFGRVTPEQKEDLVQALRSRGRYVAMIGDGVNDVIALKHANVAVGMQGGSQAARGVSDLVLLNDTFAPLPYAFREGQRIINGMNDILHIFMVRIAYKATIIAAITALGGFPFAPRQASLVSFVSVGVPAVALAAWAKPGPAPRTGLFKLLGRFVLPTTLLLLLMSIAVYQIYAVPAKDAYLAIHPDASATQLLEHAYPAAQTALTLFASFCSILLVLFAVPPSKWFAGGAKLRGDWRIMGVVTGLLRLDGGRAGHPARAPPVRARGTARLAVLRALRRGARLGGPLPSGVAQPHPGPVARDRGRPGQRARQGEGRRAGQTSDGPAATDRSGLGRPRVRR